MSFGPARDFSGACLGKGVQTGQLPTQHPSAQLRLLKKRRRVLNPSGKTPIPGPPRRGPVRYESAGPPATRGSRPGGAGTPGVPRQEHAAAGDSAGGSRRKAEPDFDLKELTEAFTHLDCNPRPLHVPHGRDCHRRASSRSPRQERQLLHQGVDLLLSRCEQHISGSLIRSLAPRAQLRQRRFARAIGTSEARETRSPAAGRANRRQR
ncbi:uncharacterized protein [Nyctibius grandis]|uniref:uncharacterized protein n=1 Tax=Nyctibius grandis TaxID=48427 RepID=UPI0035BC1E97